MGYSPWGHKESDMTERLIDPARPEGRPPLLPQDLRVSAVNGRKPGWSTRLCAGSCGVALGSWAVTGTGSGKEQDFEGRQFGIYISAPWVTLGKLPKVSALWFPGGLVFGVCINVRSHVLGLHIEDSVELPAVGVLITPVLWMGELLRGVCRVGAGLSPEWLLLLLASPLPPPAGPVLGGSRGGTTKFPLLPVRWRRAAPRLATHRGCLHPRGVKCGGEEPPGWWLRVRGNPGVPAGGVG